MVIKQIENWLDLVALLKKLNVRREEQVFSKSRTENDNWDERERTFRGDKLRYTKLFVGQHIPLNVLFTLYHSTLSPN